MDPPQGSVIYTIGVLESRMGDLLFGSSRGSGLESTTFLAQENWMQGFAAPDTLVITIATFVSLLSVPV